MIRVDSSLCLGCRSCFNVCPSQNIIRSEANGRATVHWKSCKEECDLCVKMCPSKALSLVSGDEAEPPASSPLTWQPARSADRYMLQSPCLSGLSRSCLRRFRRMQPAWNGSGSVRSVGAIKRLRA